jgi:hypothetical protein
MLLADVRPYVGWYLLLAVACGIVVAVGLPWMLVRGFRGSARSRDPGPWRAAQCSHCRKLVASALAEVQVKAGIAGGMPPSYVELICRAKAESGQIQAS